MRVIKRIGSFFLGIGFYSVVVVLSLMGLLGLIILLLGSVFGFIELVFTAIGGTVVDKLDWCECILTEKYYRHLSR
jgi:hypothetical protein